MGAKPIPERYTNVIPFLVCNGAGKVIEFCQKAFDAKISDMHKTDDGTIMHAAIHIRDSAIMLSDGSPQFPSMPSMLHIYVEDVDSVYKKAIDAGGVSLREPTNEFYGDRSCGVKDSSGNQWWIATHIEDLTPEEIERRQKEMKK